MSEDYPKSFYCPWGPAEALYHRKPKARVARIYEWVDGDNLPSSISFQIKYLNKDVFIPNITFKVVNGFFYQKFPEFQISMLKIFKMGTLTKPYGK